MPRPVKTKWSLAVPDEPMGRWILATIERLVSDHHEHLDGAIIAVAFCDELPPKNGRSVLGTAKVLGEKDRLLTGIDLIVSLDKLAWDFAAQDQRVALLDHELCHFGLRMVDEAGTPQMDDQGRVLYQIRPHDIEEFHAVIRRHGAWLEDLQQTVDAIVDSPACRQLRLKLDEVEATGAPS